jgi:hypothetical protein
VSQFLLLVAALVHCEEANNATNTNAKTDGSASKVSPEIGKNTDDDDSAYTIEKDFQGPEPTEPSSTTDRNGHVESIMIFSYSDDDPRGLES